MNLVQGIDSLLLGKLFRIMWNWSHLRVGYCGLCKYLAEHLVLGQFPEL